MGYRVDRDTGASTMSTPENDVIEALRNARPTEPDVRHLIGDTLKRLSINGKNVTGGGLSFTVGNAGLGVDAGEASGTPAAEALQTVQISPVPPVEHFVPPQIPPLPLAISPEITTPSEPGAVPAPIPATFAPPPNVEIPQIPAVGLIPLTVTGAVNGVPAIAVIGAYSPFTPIE